jgi:hypothetical protein
LPAPAPLASALLTLLLALGAAPSPSAQGQAPSLWAFEYVQFATPSDGWAMAYKNGPNRFTELFTSHDGGRRWHDVTPPVVVAGENASFDNLLEPQSPFVLDSHDAWLPLLHDEGYGRYKVYLFMTSDAGRRWALRGRFPEDEVLGLFFPSPSTGFVETDDGAAMNGDPVQVYATSDGGQHWREASASPPLGAPGGSSTAIGDYCYKNGVSFATARVGFATEYCLAGPAYLQRTNDGGRKWAGIIIAPRDGDDGAAIYPPVFSSPELGSMVVEAGPAVLVATTTDAGRHWGPEAPPPAGGAAAVGRRRLPTWLRGLRLGPDLAGRGGPRTVHDHRRRVLLASVALTHGPYQLAARFPEPEGGLGIRGRRLRAMGRPHGPPVAYHRWRAALVDILAGRPLSPRPGGSTRYCGPNWAPVSGRALARAPFVFGTLPLNLDPGAN